MALSIDYRSFSEDGPKSKTINRQWWKASDAEMPEAIAACIHTLQEAQTAVDGQRSICTRLYGNSPLYGINGLTYSKIPSQTPAIKDRITYNLCQSVVDTVTAKIAKNRPKPLFLTERGNYKIQRKAKKLNQFMDGVFFQNRVRESSPLIFRDAGIIGTGIIHTFPRYNQVAYERMMAGELLVDEMEALYGEPRQAHRVKNVDRLVLAAAFPSKSKKIMDVNEALDPTAAARPHVSDQITVAESWHLPSGPDATDGLHTIIIDGETLFKERWEKDSFPFSFLHWSKRQYGFWGQSLVEQIQNIQLEINKLLWVIQRSMHLAGSFKIFIEQGSKIVKEHLNNDIGAIITYTGPNAPQYVVPPIIAPEVYQHLNTLIQRGFEQAGVSMLSATSKKPEGLDSGRALREFNDIESERFMIVGQSYEQFHLDLAKNSIECARDIYKQKKNLTVRVPGRKFIETINWKDVDLEDDQYVLQAFPISSLPTDPAGRTATIQEYIQAGWIDAREGRRLMDMPDLDQVNSLENAMEERILSILDKIIDEGVFTSPDQYMDPMLAKKLCLQYINEYSTEGIEEEKLMQLETFNTQLDVIEAKANQGMMPPTQPIAAGNGSQPLSPGLSLPPPVQPQPLIQ